MALVERLRRRKIKHVIGYKKHDDESSLRGVEVKRKDTWDIYVGNMDVNVSESQIVEYLKNKEISVRK